MKKSFLIFMFCASSGLIIASGYDSDRDSQSSAFSNHGWHDFESFSNSEFSELTQTGKSAASVVSQDLITSVSPVKLAWDSSDAYSYRADGFVDLAAADRIHASWLTHLDDESLQKKCTLIQGQAVQYTSIIDSEFLGEFIRRHPEGLNRALAGSKRGRGFSQSEADTLCEGIDCIDSGESKIEGLFEKFKTRDLDICLACIDARNEELQHYLLVTLAPKADFKKVVDEQVENDRMRKMLNYKKQLDLGLDDLDFANTKKELQQRNLITTYFPKSLVPYPVGPVKFPDSSKKSVELK